MLGITNVYRVCNNDVNMSTNQIKSQAVPTLYNDLVNKKYADGHEIRTETNTTVTKSVAANTTRNN